MSKENRRKISKLGHQKRKPVERAEDEYFQKSEIERKSLVEYFKNHREFGSEEWYDSDKIIRGRNQSDSKKCGKIAQQDAPFRCPKCKRAWQFAGASKKDIDKMMYLSPSVWKTMPLAKKLCYWCHLFINNEGEMWTEDYE